MKRIHIFIAVLTIVLFLLYGVLDSWAEAVYVLLLFPVLDLIVILVYPEILKNISK